MNETQALVDTIILGIQEKKGHGITVVDLSEIDGAITKFFIICEGNSPSQVEAIAGEVSDKCRGLEQSIWVAMDYVDVMVHIFVPETREFYDLEHLWEDAKITYIEDID